MRIHIAPDRTFLLCGLVFGVLLVFLTPPFQVPDEYNHFYRVYQISQGVLIPVKLDNRVGGLLPASLPELGRTTSGIPFNPEVRMGQTRRSLAFSVRNNPAERVFVDFNNTALMSFVPYIHQAAAVWVARQLTDRTVSYLYVARLANLMVWLLLVWASIRLATGVEWLVVAVSLMPTTLHLAASMSYDAFTISAAILFVALLYHVAFRPAVHLRAVQGAAIAAAAFMLAMSKFAYLPLLVILFFLPQRLFDSRWGKLKFIGLVCGPALVAWLGWTLTASGLYVSYDDYHPSYRPSAALVKGVEPEGQIGFMSSNPVAAGKTLLSGLADKEVYETMIARTGWFDTVYPDWFLMAWFCLFGMLLFFPGCKSVRLARSMRFGMFLASVLSTLFFVMLLYMQWNPVGSKALYGLQGRYLIPILLPLLVSICCSRRAESPQLVRYFLPVAFMLSCSFVLVVVWSRYYLNV